MPASLPSLLLQAIKVRLEIEDDHQSIELRLSRHAVQLLLGHTMIEGTVRYLSIEVDDALAIAEQIDISRRAAWRAWQGIVASSGYPLPRA